MLAAVTDTLRAPAGDGAVRRVAAALEAAVTDDNQLEASVRRAGGGALRGRRIMVERAPAALARAVSIALGVDLDAFERLIAAASDARVPLIAGWDVGGDAPIAKLYANASDASAGVRETLASRLGLPGAAHVVGVNATAGGARWKLYRQHPDPAALAAEVGGAAPWLADRAAGIAVAGVASWDVSGDEATPRAFFVAIGTPHGARARAVVDALPGAEPAAVAAALPFLPGPVRSVGVAVADRDAWTAYFKPRGADDPIYALDPVAALRAGGAEVGIYIEPRRPDGRAYVTTDRHAISYRVRDGDPDRDAVESLMGWVAARVRDAERTGAPADLTSPPEPWHVVGA